MVEYKSAFTINDRMFGKFSVHMAGIYTKLAGILMEKEEFEAALSFYCKAYGIYDTLLGIHDHTKQTLMNVKLAAQSSREKGGNSDSDILIKVEKEFKKRHPSVSGEEGLSSKHDEEEENEDGEESKKKKKKNGKKKKKKKEGEDSNHGEKTKTDGNEEEFDII